MDEANFAALVDLTQRLPGAILLGHSQSGRFPFEAILRGAKGVRAVVAIEPAGCNAAIYSEAEIAQLATVPTLVVFGDHLEMKQVVGPVWQPFFEDCQRFVQRVSAAGGRAAMLHLPARGIPGNSHMLMQDKNNLQIADLIIAWSKQVAPKRHQ